MKNPKIIGICGHLRAGKDTAANLLQSIDSRSFVRDAFANRLKRCLESLVGTEFGWNIFELTGEHKELVRPLMIEMGRIWRKIDINHWVKEVDNKYDLVNDKTGTTLIITDFRYLNEYLYFKSKYGNDFVLLEVVRTDATHKIPQEEIENQPMLSRVADYKIEWDTVGDSEVDLLQPYINKFYKKYFN